MTCEKCCPCQAEQIDNAVFYHLSVTDDKTDTNQRNVDKIIISIGLSVSKDAVEEISAFSVMFVQRREKHAFFALFSAVYFRHS